MATTNVAWRDAVIRGFLAGLLLLAAALLQTRPFVALGVGFIGIAVVGTALFRVCPLYTVLGISTLRKAQPENRRPPS